MTPTKKILLTDSNEAAANYVKDMLQYYGYGTKIAAGWEQARLFLDQEHFDALLFDESMIHRGLGTPLNWLRADGYDQPVLIMSDIALNEMWNNCLEYGHVELINKPVSPSTLKFMVEAALKKSRSAKVIPVIRLNRVNTAAALQAS